MRVRDKSATGMMGGAFALWFLLLSGGAVGASSTGQERGEAWEFSLAPYLFLPLSTEGTSTVAGSSVDLNMDLSDVLEVLDVAFSTRFEARRGRLGVAADLYYVDLGLSEGATLIPRKNPDLGISAALNVDVDVRQGWGSLMGMYRVLEPRGSSAYPLAMDLMLGARWNYLKQEVDATLDIGIAPGIQTRLGGSESWWEPTAGLRVGTQVSSCLTLALRAEVGGFGSGGDDLQWVVLAGAERSFGSGMALRFGYQFYSIDFSTRKNDGTFAYDIDQQGPYAAFVWRW